MTTICKQVMEVVKGSQSDVNGRRIFFQTENIDVDMHLCPDESRWTIIGQVLSGEGRLLPPLMVYLMREGHQIQTATTNYIGEFTFFNVESAALALEIQLPDGRVVGNFEAR